MTRSDELRRRIVDVAAELFAEHGYHSTKLAMVAERAGGVSAHGASADRRTRPALRPGDRHQAEV